MTGMAESQAGTVAGLLALAAGLSLVPLGWLAWRHRASGPAARLAALTALTLFLTLDLIAFGAFTRLTDSGLGCPDWPGCYGELHPVAAQDQIEAAQALLPNGPVTPAKAWIEMIHRYLAMVVGALILLLALASWRWRRHLPHSLAWPWFSLAWVLLQGLFGRFTVTLKLYPAIVSLHWLGAMGLLALLLVQHETFLAAVRPRRIALGSGLRLASLVALALLAAQLALGAWVSTNYAVLACQGFPQCNGQWWPEADFGAGFTLLRDLGRGAAGEFLPAAALVAIHWSHRLMALALGLALLLLGLGLRRVPAARPHANALLLLLCAQWLTGIGNVVLQWPLLGALMHSVGAAGLLAVLLSLICRWTPPPSPNPVVAGAVDGAHPVS